MNIHKVAVASLFVSICVLGLKTLAWWLTDSTALYADALESTVNIATALAALIAVRLADTPPDDGHPYGHHKAEYLSAVLVGVLIIVAALAILRESVVALLNPQPVTLTGLALGTTVLATLINGAWGSLLVKQGRQARSPALEADGKHVLLDVITSAAVLVGIGLVALSGWHWLDPVLAGLVALHVLWNGWEVMTDSVSGLMDAALPLDERTRIETIIRQHADGALEFHDLRTRRAGRMTFIDFHLIVPGRQTVLQAHHLCDALEHALRSEVSPSLITIHVEPEHKAKGSAKSRTSGHGAFQLSGPSSEH